MSDKDQIKLTLLFLGESEPIPESAPSVFPLFKLLFKRFEFAVCSDEFDDGNSGTESLSDRFTVAPWLSLLLSPIVRVSAYEVNGGATLNDCDGKGSVAALSERLRSSKSYIFE